jgi:hypothetical protein
MFSSFINSVGMKRMAAIAVFSILIAMNVRGAAGSDVPRLVILHGHEMATDFMREVKQRLESQLIGLGLKTIVVLRKTSNIPKDDGDWEAAVHSVKIPRGTVAVVGLQCNPNQCRLTVMPPRGDFLAKVTVEKSEKDRETRITAVVSTLRETVLGPLLPELGRLDQEGQTPTPPPLLSDDAVLLKSPFESERSETQPTFRPWLWLSAGYHGDHPHPGGYPLHGPFIGVDVTPTNLLGAGISVGWLGIRREEVLAIEASVHRIDLSLALRLLFSLGPAKVSISAIGRFDIAFVHIDAANEQADEKDRRFELQTGGLTMWHLPLPKRLNAWVGAGVLVSLISKSVEVDVGREADETVMDASTVRLIWCAGVAFSPLQK